jgi:hypothetical protein
VLKVVFDDAVSPSGCRTIHTHLPAPTPKLQSLVVALNFVFSDRDGIMP